MEFISDAVTKLMVPNDWINAKGDDAQENCQEIIHGLFSVVWACERVDIVHKPTPYNDAINSKSDKGQKNGFPHAKVSS